MRRSDLFDVHAAGRGCHHDDAFQRAIHQHRQIKLPRDRQGLFDQQPVHGLAVRRILVGHQRLAQQAIGKGLRFSGRLDDFHAACLAASASMHLGLDHPGIARDLLGGSCRRFSGLGDLPGRDSQAVAL